MTLDAIYDIIDRTFTLIVLEAINLIPLHFTPPNEICAG